MNIFETESILKKYNLFWQYPVITEKEFFNQNKFNPDYCGLPWATFLDKFINKSELFKILIPYMKHKNYYTCCQHISFRKFIPLMKVLGIKTLYTPHKIIGENNINGIDIISCPLYAVNVEDKKRNNEFKNINFETCNRKYLYSFVGGYQPRDYLTDIRKKIFNIKKNKHSLIINTGSWHFNNVVYSKSQNSNGDLNENNDTKKSTINYNNILINSRFSLCPSGSGPNSIRFWESLAVGSIPILLSDTLELPKNKLWKNAIVIIKEKDVSKIEEVLNNISFEKEKIMRVNCLKIYNHFKNNYINKNI